MLGCLGLAAAVLTADPEELAAAVDGIGKGMAAAIRWAVGEKAVHIWLAGAEIVMKCILAAPRI